jgi:hypothetical protein
METLRNYWREKCLNALFTLQALFLGTAIWDFFLTVIIETSKRSEVFAVLAPGLSGIILIPWLGSIIILTLFLFRVLMRKHYDKPLLKPLHIGYFILFLVYLILMILALINPVITWPLVMNYFINGSWAVAILYFRIKILSAVEAGK